MAWLASLKVVVETLKMINELYKQFLAWKDKLMQKKSDEIKEQNTESANNTQIEIAKPMSEQDNDVLRDELRKKHNRG